ncbi:hypothetical protein SCACP_07820 [Sporomusa carbonis]
MLLEFAEFLTYGVLQISRDTRLGDAVSFFIYDTIKISIRRC